VSHIAPQIQEKTVSEERTIAIDFRGKLDSGELLTGTPIITEVTTSDLTLTSKAVNTAELTINDLTVAIGEAVQCLVTGGLAATRNYVIQVQCGTDSTPAQTVRALIKLTVLADT